MNTILFDIDGTLFDSKKFAADAWTLISKNFDIPFLKLREVIDSYYLSLGDKTKFNPKDLISAISKQLNADKNSMWKIFWENKGLYGDAIFYDTLGALNFAKKNFNVGVFSQGFFDFQKHKLEMMGVLDYFNPELLFVTTDKSQDKFLKTLPENSIIIEDTYEVVTKLSEFKPIWINRNSDENDPDIPTIHSLTGLEALPVLRNNVPPEL